MIRFPKIELTPIGAIFVSILLNDSKFHQLGRLYLSH